MATLLKGEIRTATIPPVAGIPGPNGQCHVLILSSDNFNHRSNLVVVMPVVYSVDSYDEFDAFQIQNAEEIRLPAWVLLDQIRPLPDDRIGERVGIMGPGEVSKVLRAFAVHILS